MRHISLVCLRHVVREGVVGQGFADLFEKILLTVVRAMMLLPLLLRKHSSRVHKQTDKTKGRRRSVCKRYRAR